MFLFSSICSVFSEPCGQADTKTCFLTLYFNVIQIFFQMIINSAFWFELLWWSPIYKPSLPLVFIKMLYNRLILWAFFIFSPYFPLLVVKLSSLNEAVGPKLTKISWSLFKRSAWGYALKIAVKCYSTHLSVTALEVSSLGVPMKNCDFILLTRFIYGGLQQKKTFLRTSLSTLCFPNDWNNLIFCFSLKMSILFSDKLE